MNKLAILFLGLFIALVAGYIYQNVKFGPLILLFRGNGYATFAAGCDYNPTATSFSCGLKTSADEGLILYGKANDGDMFSARLSDGIVIAEVDTGSGVVSLISNARVDDDKWHEINLIRDGRFIALKVDNETVVGSAGSMTAITRPNIIYVGGGELGVSPGFVGRLKNIRFANSLVKDDEFDLSNGGVTLLR